MRTPRFFFFFRDVEEVTALPVQTPTLLKVRVAFLGLVLAVSGAILEEFVGAVGELAFHVVSAISELQIVPAELHFEFGVDGRGSLGFLFGLAVGLGGGGGFLSGIGQGYHITRQLIIYCGKYICW